MIADLKKFISNKYPFWLNSFQPDPPVISNLEASIEKTCFESIKEFISEVYKIRDNKSYVTHVLKQYPQLKPQKQKAVLMSFDFHILEDQPKLIEINTNASFALPSYLLTDFKNPNHRFKNFLIELKQSFENDFALFSNGQTLKNIMIVDESPEKQRAFFEFKMYQDLFHKWGWTATIQDVSHLDTNLKDYFIYNRHTDFYFSHDLSKNIKFIYDHASCCISPHPMEYALLADKERLIDFSKSDIPIIQKVVPLTTEITNENKEKIWSERKKLFFKPKSSFGSKAVYKGESVSRKVFESFKQGEMIAQEYIPTPTIEGFKWDLRCYVYNGNIQLMIARFYKGQATNFRELGGGLGVVNIKN